MTATVPTTAPMSNELDGRLKRAAPLSGMAWAVVFSVYVVLEWVSAPDFGKATPAEIVAYYTHDKASILGGSLLAGVAGLLFLWWAGCLRSAVAAAEGGTARLANVAYGSAVAALAIGLSAPVMNAAGAIRVDQTGTIDPATATAIFDISQIMFGAAEQAAASAMVLATAVAALRYRAVLPRWLALVSLLLAIALLLPAISLVALAVAVVWISILSGLLYVQRAGAV
jgi:hypothetical protein